LEGGRELVGRVVAEVEVADERERELALAPGLLEGRVTALDGQRLDRRAQDRAQVARIGGDVALLGSGEDPLQEAEAVRLGLALDGLVERAQGAGADLVELRLAEAVLGRAAELLLGDG